MFMHTQFANQTALTSLVNSIIVTYLLFIAVTIYPEVVRLPDTTGYLFHRCISSLLVTGTAAG